MGVEEPLDGDPDFFPLRCTPPTTMQRLLASKKEAAMRRFFLLTD